MRVEQQSNSNYILNLVSIVMLSVSSLLLGSIALERYLAPMILYLLMIMVGVFLIVVFSNKNEITLKVKLFIIFFSLYLIYTLLQHYFLISLYPDSLPYVYLDEPKFYKFSELGLPYVSGEKNIIDLYFDIYKNKKMFLIHEFPLHVLFTSIIVQISIIIDGSYSIIAQKFFSPFIGGMFSVVLYSTIKYQFKDTVFSINATIAYALFTAVFMYSTVVLRDIDIALTYMIFIYIFLQNNSIRNFILLIFIAFLTFNLRSESGLVLYGLTMLYAFLIVKNLDNQLIRILFYIVIFINLLAVLYLLNIVNMVSSKVENIQVARGAAVNVTKDSFSLVFDKLPIGLSHIVKTMFGQLNPFPLFKNFAEFPLILQGLFWPFIDLILLYTVIHKEVRALLDEKIKILLIVAIVILLLMSSEPLPRRMMSVYPIIYITALYGFFNIPKDKIKKIYFIFLIGIISLNVLYYLMKLR